MVLQIVYCDRKGCREPAHGYRLRIPVEAKRCEKCGHPLTPEEKEFYFCSLKHLKEFLEEFEE